MECRWALVFAVGLGCGTVGCVHTDSERKWTSDTPNQSADGDSILSPSSDHADVSADKDKPKRKPKPSTFVSMGKLREKAADDPSLPPSEQAKIREEAEACYQQAIKLDPKNLPAYQALGNLYDKMGYYDRAVKTFQNALSACPKGAVLYFDFGMCQLRHKEWDAGVANLRKATDLEPKNLLYAKALGFSLARVGRFDESYARLKDLVGEAHAHYYLARMLHHLEQNTESMEHVQLALQADPKLKPALMLLDELQGRIPDPQQGQASLRPEEQ